LPTGTTANRCQDEELQKAKHANYRDMVNYEALEVRLSAAFVINKESFSYFCIIFMIVKFSIRSLLFLPHHLKLETD
jgi:hypothetical protein